MAGLDGFENISIARMIWTWPNLSADLVAHASAATQAKLVLGVCTEIAMAVLAAIALWRWRARARKF